MSTGLLLTTADLELMPDDGRRYELLEGELVVSRSPSLKHQNITVNIIGIMLGYLEQNPIGRCFQRLV